MDAVPFADIAVGQELPSNEYVVSADDIAAYCRALGVRVDQARPEAPPTFATVYLRDVRRALPAPPGGIHAAQRFTFHEPMRAGDRIRVTTRVAEKYVRRERRYVVLDTDMVRADGAPVCSGRSTRIWAA